MSTLRTKQRKSMHKDAFAYVDVNGEGHLPLNDATHVRNAIARWNQTAFPSVSAKEHARQRIVAAARRHKVEISGDDKVVRSTSSLRPTITKRGPRGGRKVVTKKRPTTTAQRKAARRNVKKALRARLK